MSNSNSDNFLRKAAQLVQGEIADATASIQETTEARNKAVWQAVCNLICHAAINVFGDGKYTYNKAAEFKTQVVEAFGKSAKQAGKYTETITLALGVRVKAKSDTMRLGGINGLRAVATSGVDEVYEFLKAKEIETLGALRAAMKREPDEIANLAKKFAKLDKADRETMLAMVKKLDETAALETKGKADTQPATRKVNGNVAAQAGV